jgi:DNA-binding NtrC family response regulator
MRILLVDDDTRIGASVVRMLRRDHQVTYVEDITAAKVALAEMEFDGILSDIRMPGGTGTDLHRWLQERKHPLAGCFLLMTGVPAAPRHQEHLEAHQIPCLSKPFTKEELLEHLGLLQSSD